MYIKEKKRKYYLTIYNFKFKYVKKTNLHDLHDLRYDLRYLVENIWNSQSVLSAHEDLFDLILVLWNKYE